MNKIKIKLKESGAFEAKYDIVDFIAKGKHDFIIQALNILEKKSYLVFGKYINKFEFNDNGISVIGFDTNKGKEIRIGISLSINEKESKVTVGVYNPLAMNPWEIVDKQFSIRELTPTKFADFIWKYFEL